VKGPFAASYWTDKTTEPKAVLTLLSASADMDLYSKTRPLNLYDSKLEAIEANHGKVADYPGLSG
jgi:hypothetical protein